MVFRSENLQAIQPPCKVKTSGENLIKRLLLQGHRRKNWKVRKFTLRDNPAYMHYYDPTKVSTGNYEPTRRKSIFSFLFSCSNFIFSDWLDSIFLPVCQSDDPLGSIHLRGSVVTAVEFVPDGELSQDTHALRFPPSGNTIILPAAGVLISRLATLSSIQPKSTTSMATSLRSSPPMRLTTSSKQRRATRERSGSMRYRQCQEVGSERRAGLYLYYRFTSVFLKTIFMYVGCCLSWQGAKLTSGQVLLFFFLPQLMVQGFCLWYVCEMIFFNIVTAFNTF